MSQLLEVAVLVVCFVAAVEMVVYVVSQDRGRF